MVASPKLRIWRLLASTAIGSRDPTLQELIHTVARSFASYIRWSDHFVWDGPELKASTAIGRVTIAVLFINDPELIVLRRALQQVGVFSA